ncbi:MAG: Oligosaccharyl transferase [Candidatus Ozemobacter sibiricus]|jgi:asparagine N-glycosylation enzyme membrane subunit Stt3|uniref:Oligosaccharyl transferase n=1 Tax=Candidatus Ozemobacter sibiricus TaxID=2268124 RepID=A0A367ZTY4_9BACT|nr:MAG: Oligosaccharyl transferase [Candidatus Ozemobacter sibiricus]
MGSCNFPPSEVKKGKISMARLGESPVERAMAIQGSVKPRGWAGWEILLVLGILWGTALVWQFSSIEAHYPWLGRYPMFDPDAVLYLRWTEQALLRGASLSVDHYHCFPEPYVIDFPPYYRKILLQFVWLTYRFFPDCSLRPEFVVGILPPLAAGFLSMAIILWFWLRRREKTFLLLLGIGMFPGFSLSAAFAFMNLDHHWLEVSCIWIWIILAAEFLETGRPWAEIAGGLAMTLFLGTWNGAPLWHFIICLLALRWFLRGGLAGERFCEFASSTLLIAGFLMLGHLYFVQPGPKSWAINHFGWLQPTLATMGGFFCWLLRATINHEKVTWRVILSGSAIVLSGIGILGWVFREPILAARSFLFRQHPIISAITEMQPIIRSVNSSATWRTLVGIFGLNICGVPLLWSVHAERWLGNSGRVVRDATILFLALALWQIRFIRWLAIGMGVLNGCVLANVWHLVKISHGGESKRWVAPLMVGIFLMAQLGVGFSSFWPPAKQPPPVGEALTWLREKTPPTSGYVDDHAPPEYGVLTFWDLGNFIAYYAQRPPVTSNTLLGVRLMAQLFTAESEEEAFERFRAARVRYFFVYSGSPVDQEFHRMMALLKNSPSGVEFDHVPPTPPPDFRCIPFWEAFYAWVVHGMTFIATGKFPEMPSRCRWVYVSKETEQRLPVCRILEIVPGAEVVGQGDPGTKVQGYLSLVLGKFPILFTASATVDAGGKYRLRVPYATSSRSGRVQTGAHFLVHYLSHGATQTAKIQIPEEMVLAGAEIRVDGKINELATGSAGVTKVDNPSR